MWSGLCVLPQLVSDCQPENGSYGFHLFGNIEELLPVLNRPRRRRSKKQVAYYEVGNLNTETYPGAANLPAYVRENYGQGGHHGYSNIDRVIISYQLNTGVVEMVYVTEHDGEDFGRFSADRTHEISFELIEALQSPQMDLTTFLTRTGYYEDIEELYYPEPAAEQIFDTMQTYSGSVARATFTDNFQFFAEAFLQRIGVDIEPPSYDRQADYVVNITSNNSRHLTSCSDVPRKCRKPKAAKRSRALRQSYWPSGWEQPFTGYDEGGKRDKGGSGFFKILLSAGALCLAAVCFSWLRSSWKADVKDNTLKMIPWRSPSLRHTHIMLDYVY